MSGGVDIHIARRFAGVERRHAYGDSKAYTNILWQRKRSRLYACGCSPWLFWSSWLPSVPPSMWCWTILSHSSPTEALVSSAVLSPPAVSCLLGVPEASGQRIAREQA